MSPIKLNIKKKTLNFINDFNVSLLDSTLCKMGENYRKNLQSLRILVH